VRRREFIKLFGGAVAAWPKVGHAQRATVPVIGYLRSTGTDGFAHLTAALRKGLNESNYFEGRNVTIESRFAENRPERLPALTADLIDQRVAAIVANTSAALAAKDATNTIPIVFATGSDPVRDGLVTSLNRPGGNVTGVVFFSGVLGAKRLALLRQLAPNATTVAVLMNFDTREAEEERRDVEAAGQAAGLQVIAVDPRNNRDIEPAFETFAKQGAGALIVGSGPFLNSNREQIVALAAQHRLPASYSLREFSSAGGLMSYGASQTAAYRQAGLYVARILKGERPADLPVMQATQFEFVLNLKTAKALDLEIPPGVLAIADEVLE
jgi:putative tryptophan/tyrosine transport system substrate-binding protein